MASYNLPICKYSENEFFKNKGMLTDRHDIPEILLKVTLNTIKTTKSELNREVQNIY
jgi:hypothetical protein